MLHLFILIRIVFGIQTTLNQSYAYQTASLTFITAQAAKSLILTFPAEFDLTASYCSNQEYTCQINLNTLSITTTLLQKLEFLMNNIKMPDYNMSGIVVADQQFVDGTALIENVPFQISLQKAQGQFYFSVLQSFTLQTITLIGANFFPPYTLRIVFPSLNKGASNEIVMREVFEQQFLVAPQNMQITIDNVYSPNSQLLDQLFHLQWFNSKNQYLMDQSYALTDLNVQIFQVNAPIISITSSDTVLLQKTTLTFTIQPQLSYPIQSKIIMKVELTNNFLNIIDDAIFLTLGITSIQGLTVLPSWTFSQQIIEISSISISSNDPIIFQITNFPNPMQQYQFSFEIRDNKNILVEQTSSPTQQIVTNNFITDLVISANMTINSVGPLILKFTLPSQQTKITNVFLQIPIEISVDPLCCVVTSTELITQSNCKIDGNSISIENIFQSNINLPWIQIELIIIQPKIVTQTSNFQFYTKSNNQIISQLAQGFSIQTTAAQFEFSQFNCASKQIHTLTNCLITIQLPEVVVNSVNNLLNIKQILVIRLSEYYSSQLTSCQSYSTDCKIVSGEINVVLVEKKLIQINLFDILTERNLGQNSYTISGEITYNSIIQFIMKQVEFKTEISIPLSFNDYSIDSSNSEIGAPAQLTIKFKLNTLLESSDILLIEFPKQATIISCDPFCVQDTMITTQIKKDNEIKVNIINPSQLLSLEPFNYKVITAEGNLIALFQDLIGIKQDFIVQKPQFQFNISSIFLYDFTSLNLTFKSSIPMYKYYKGRVNFDLNFLNVHNISCEIVSCEQLKQDEQNHLQFMTYNYITEDIWHTVVFNGLKLVVPSAQVVNITMSFQILDQFNNILSNDKQSNLFNIKCSPFCKDCSTKYDQCDTCFDNFINFNQQCVSTCPTGYVMNNQKCIQCLTPSICNQCDANKPEECLDCQTGYMLVDGFCVQQSQVDEHTYVPQTNDTQTQEQQQQALKRLTEMYDGIPIYVIIICGQFALCLIYKLKYRKQVIFWRTFYIWISCLDLVVGVIRMIRFGLLLEAGYFYLSICCLATKIFFQISNAIVLQTMEQQNISFIKLTSKHPYLKKLMLLYQWRIILAILPIQDSLELKEQIFKLFKGQMLVQFLPILVMISYLSENSFRFFVLDDLLYNSLVLILSLFRNYWILETNYTSTTIVPTYDRDIKETKLGQTTENLRS